MSGTQPIFKPFSGPLEAAPSSVASQSPQTALPGAITFPENLPLKLRLPITNPELFEWTWIPNGTRAPQECAFVTHATPINQVCVNPLPDRTAAQVKVSHLVSGNCFDYPVIKAPIELHNLILARRALEEEVFAAGVSPGSALRFALKQPLEVQWKLKTADAAREVCCLARMRDHEIGVRLRFVEGQGPQGVASAECFVRNVRNNNVDIQPQPLNAEVALSVLEALHKQGERGALKRDALMPEFSLGMNVSDFVKWAAWHLGIKE